MRKKVLVVTHDAGGSEIIAAYVKKHRNRVDFHVYTNGPGARVFKRLCIPFRLIRDERSSIRQVIAKNRDCSLLLTSMPGWMTTIEQMALEEAKRSGMRRAAYLEDWQHYRQRLGYPNAAWKDSVPEELWAGDRVALRIARKQFAGLTLVKSVPNEYFKSVVDAYHAAKETGQAYVLFLSSAWGKGTVFADLVHFLASERSTVGVRIRFHPADKRGRYDAVIRKYKGRIHIERSTEKNIVDDLKGAKVVVGTRTVALVLSALCGVETFDIDDEGTRPPFKHLTRTKNIRNVHASIRRALR